MGTAKPDRRTEPQNSETDFGLIQLYVLHRTAIEPVSSREIARQSAQRGFVLSPGSASQILRGLQKKGYIAATTSGRHSNVEYLATPQGRTAIKDARKKLRDLFNVLSQ